MAEGQRVLFVAEKRAALDVVQDAARRGRHGPVLARPARQGQQAGRGARADPARARARASPSTEQGLQAAPTRTCERRRQLTRYAQRLHEENGAGLSLLLGHDQLLTLAR